MKKKGMFTGCFALLALLFSAAAFAGSLDAPSDPGSTGSYTLEDIWNRLNDGTDGSQSTFSEPGAVPGSTGYTIDDVMSIAPAKDDTNGATPADVLTGKTFWGLTSGAWSLQSGTAASFETVRRTGQTGCWDASGAVIACAGTGQDGELQKGDALPSPRFTEPTPADGTVTDNLTGLTWLKNANCWGVINWTTATSNAAALANGQCGLTDGSAAGDWRLPNVKELQSLIHYGYSSPALSNTAGTAKWTAGNPFTNVQSDFYWSATAYAGNTTRAWYVGLNYGYVINGTKADAYYVWPVR